MTCAQGSRTGLAYVVETGYGVLPATPILQAVPYKTHSLDFAKTLVEGADIYPDRMQRVSRHGTGAVSGSVEIDMRRGEYDALLENVFMNDFVDDVLKIGTTRKFMTIEDSANDIGQFRAFSGVAFNSFAMNIAPNQAVTGVFNAVGKGMTQETTSVSASVATDPLGYEPFDSFSNPILEAGSSLAIVTALDFTLNNGLAVVPAIGSSTSVCMDYGMATVTGTMSLRYTDKTIIDKFLNEVESSLTITVDDRNSSNSYTFTMPRVKFNGSSVPVANPQGRVLTVPFVALFDDVTESLLSVTRPTSAP